MSAEFRHIVRLMGKDLDGARRVAYALTEVRGINIRLANAIVKKADIPLDKRVGFLSDIETRKIEEIVRSPEDYDLPTWLLNRRRDLATGEDIHVTSSDLDLQIKDDIERMKAMRSWRGYRHAYGLRVRGQRTRTTSRKGKAVGVRKKRGVAVGRP